ncbi:ComEA family DNA-binding protein [Paludisphaera mucosa]|uniref:Helix-hairpin-helix domain-containing protein n=1 Tax=Paludisphaera mucosa TaxID=3030827 RepID=A0ABT6FKA9_9BACT|nr:helix-hairpin-helix domain-containing protein [Paludisphaera mucosa]MDG3008010.1 helix-hairpin-helix domain-containing protein [Paludisphaera mucosa]
MPTFTEHASTTAEPRPGPWSAAGRALLTASALAAGLAMLAVAPARHARPARAPVLVVDVNAVPVEVLSALPSVGPALAREIVERRAEAPFLSLSDLARRARGVGPVTLARLARHLRAGDEVAARLREATPGR